MLPKPENEKNLTYAIGTKEREYLAKELEKIKQETIEIPIIIGGKKLKSEEQVEVRCPHDHSCLLARVHLASSEQLLMAVKTALQARSQWASFDWSRRVAIFQKAADLLSQNDRIRHVAATMMNLSKNPFEAETDVVEFIDFLRFNSFFVQQISTETSNQSEFEINSLDWRPLEGFVFAVSPFNFYALGGNISTTSAMLGNVVLWKPATSALFANYEIMKLLIRSGLPSGVINFIPTLSKNTDMLLKQPDFAGLHFTGSYETFAHLWMEIAKNIPLYKNFPRIEGETGGKDFIFVHRSADPHHVATSIIRGGFESQGQKCSAASRIYMPKSMWQTIKTLLKDELSKIPYGSVDDFQNFMGAIIDETAYKNIVSYLCFAQSNPDYEIIAGGTYDNTKGWFVAPTLIITSNPNGKLMTEEIFGPVVMVFVYDDEKYEETLLLCDATSPYALTGSVFATDREAIATAETLLRYSAGNFYINDKTTGSVVGRQPFGGARRSGTNDKTGLWLSLLRWVSPRSVKETTIPSYHWKRDFMKQKREESR
jgi:1-pyrroline-5-carboxylate dehydrogenase